MKRSLTYVVVFVLLAAPACAREGMWTPAQVGDLAEELKGMGLRIEPAQLRDLKRGPLAAVINLNGCTASFVSDRGLVVTNHHCAIGAIQRNSTEGKNRLEDGFTAATRKDELWAGPSARIRVTQSETDVTAKFREVLKDAKDDVASFSIVDSLTKSLVAECEKDERLRCQVAAYDGGARYVLIAQLDIMVV